MIFEVSKNFGVYGFITMTTIERLVEIFTKQIFAKKDRKFLIRKYFL